MVNKARMLTWQRPVVVIFVALALCASSEAVKLKFRDEECMTYTFAMYQPFYGSFVSLPDIYSMTAKYGLKVHSPSGHLVHESPPGTEAKFHLVPYESGKYKFCLNLLPEPHMSRYVVNRDVVWDLHESKTDANHAQEPGKAHIKEEDTQNLWQYVSQIDAQLQQLKATQQYLYWRERRHRQTVESTNKRVWWYALLRNVTLLAVSVGQVYFIRRLFSK